MLLSAWKAPLLRNNLTLPGPRVKPDQGTLPGRCPAGERGSLRMTASRISSGPMGCFVSRELLALAVRREVEGPIGDDTQRGLVEVRVVHLEDGRLRDLRPPRREVETEDAVGEDPVLYGDQASPEDRQAVNAVEREIGRDGDRDQAAILDVHGEEAAVVGEVERCAIRRDGQPLGPAEEIGLEEDREISAGPDPPDAEWKPSLTKTAPSGATVRSSKPGGSSAAGGACSRRRRPESRSYSKTAAPRDSSFL